MNSIIEQWLPCPGYEGIYEISSLGRVKRLSIHRIGSRENIEYLFGCKEMIFKGEARGLGYVRVSLTKDHKQKSVSVHRLVALAFLPPVLNKPLVNHINGIKSDNRVSNLEWCTYTENSRHAARLGLVTYTHLIGQNNGGAKLTDTDVLEIKALLKNGEKQNVLAKKFNVSKTCICKIKNNIKWKQLAHQS